VIQAHRQRLVVEGFAFEISIRSMTKGYRDLLTGLLACFTQQTQDGLPNHDFASCGLRKV
jgi:hypothetical protein